jgi:hypothetical protein
MPSVQERDIECHPTRKGDVIVVETLGFVNEFLRQRATVLA